MKPFAAFAAYALIVAFTMDLAMGLPKYLDELPNGKFFEQALGHGGTDSTVISAFGTAFAAAQYTWTPKLCKAKFPGSSMTNGAAFGDPCCKWEKNGTPDFTVKRFSKTPGEPTVCASGGGSTGGSTGGNSSATEAGETDDMNEKKGTETENENESVNEKGNETSMKGTETETEQGTGELDPGVEIENPPQTIESRPLLPPSGSLFTNGDLSLPPSSGGCAAKPPRKFRH